MYCNKCNKTVGYLCYTGYIKFKFDFECNCGNNGVFELQYNTNNESSVSEKELKTQKNRLCCPTDNSPLFTIVNKNVKMVKYSVTCKKCANTYKN